jgi:predicted CxxxxCH...CXXCH cytochrome family protein
VNVQDNLEFEPVTMLANDASGTTTLKVTLESRCGFITATPRTQVCANGFCHFEGGGTSGYKDIQMTVWVRTTTGEYAAKPVVTRIIYS